MAKEFFLLSTEDLHQVSGYIHDHFDDTNKPLKVVVKNHGKRSLSQNALMWVWLTEICNQIKNRGKGDFEPEDLHEYFKARYCPQKELRFGDKNLHIASTKRLDVGEMMTYMNCIHMWSIDAGFNLTIPESCEYIKLVREQSI